jgi:hypothetical protein
MSTNLNDLEEKEKKYVLDRLAADIVASVDLQKPFRDDFYYEETKHDFIVYVVGNCANICGPNGHKYLYYDENGYDILIEVNDKQYVVK